MPSIEEQLRHASKQAHAAHRDVKPQPSILASAHAGRLPRGFPALQNFDCNAAPGRLTGTPPRCSSTAP